jgi:hypothetical protein
MVEIDEGVSGPELLPQFLPGHGLAGALQEHGQNLERLFLDLRLFLDFETNAALAQFCFLKIYFEEPEPDAPRFFSGQRHETASASVT